MLDSWYEDTLKRSFTVRNCGAEHTFLYSLSKNNFVAMKTEEREIYDDFLRRGLADLLKTITVKLAATEVCNNVLRNWKKMNKDGMPKYEERVPLLTNRELNAKTGEEIKSVWIKRLEELKTKNAAM